LSDLSNLDWIATIEYFMHKEVIFEPLIRVDFSNNIKLCNMGNISKIFIDITIAIMFEIEARVSQKVQFSANISQDI
jgi:hypothetical protein